MKFLGDTELNEIWKDVYECNFRGGRRYSLVLGRAENLS
jgi:hypothetical protein